MAQEVVVEAADNRSLWPIAQRTAVETEERHVLADAGYSNGEQARLCKEAGIATHFRVNRAANHQGDDILFDSSVLVYEKTIDTLLCPGRRANR